VGPGGSQARSHGWQDDKVSNNPTNASRWGAI